MVNVVYAAFKGEPTASPLVETEKGMYICIH